MARKKSWNYLRQIYRKTHLLLFSSFDQDGHFERDIVDDKFDIINKIIQKQMVIEAVRDAMSKLNDEERELIKKLYYNGETLWSVAEVKNISYPDLIKRRNKIVDKLKNYWKILNSYVHIK